MTRAIFSVATAFVLLAASGCDPSTEPRAAKLLSGVLLYTDASGKPIPTAADGEHSGIVQALDAPDTVSIGEEFEVVVTTIGPNGCWTPGTMEVSASDAAAVLRPYDYHSGAELCTLIFNHFSHPATLRFVTPGEAVIRVVGRMVTEEDVNAGTEITLEKLVTVR